MWVMFLTEITKLKRSQALLMTLLCPLSVVLLQMLIMLENGGKQIAENGWGMYWMGTISLWYMLMLPLFIALITTLVNATEHKNNGWRLMAIQPVALWQCFLVKAAISWLFIVLGSLIMYGLTSLSIAAMLLIGYQGGDAFSSPFLNHLGSVLLASLPIVAIGHLVSWRVKNVVLPLAIGVICTIAALKMSNSAQYWPFNPWTYPVTSTLVADSDTNAFSRGLGSALGVLILIAGAAYIARREVHD